MSTKAAAHRALCDRITRVPDCARLGVRARYDPRMLVNTPLKGAQDMVTVGILAQVEAKPGKEDEVASFLKGALPLAEQEPATTAWFAIRLGPSRFGIFDVFPDEAGRDAHLSGPIAAALMERADELFTQPPAIEKADLLASKLAE